METGNVYCGTRASPTENVQVWRNGKPFEAEKSLAVRRHSPDGFNWGYCGSGPAQLALALLLDAIRSRTQAERWYQQFKAQVVAGWSHSWTITQAQILRWHQNARFEHVCIKEKMSDETSKTCGDSPAELPAPAQSADAGE